MADGPGRRCAAACLALAALLLPLAARAEFPDRPVRILVGFAPGGTSDLVARLVAEAAEPALGQRVIVENRAGANGVVAAESMVRGATDGTTVFQCATGLMTVTPEISGPRLPIDPATDMVAIANVADSSLALVVPPASPLRGVEDLLAAARQRPGQLTYASAGIASTAHVATAQLAQRAGIGLTHVPYRGSAPGVLDLVGGRVDLMVTNIGDVARQVHGGQLRLLAVDDALGQALFPGTPLLSAVVPGYRARFWLGLCGPRGMPEEAVRRWQEAVRAGMQRPETLRRLREGGLAPRFEDAEVFARTIASDRRMWRDVVRAADIRAE